MRENELKSIIIISLPLMAAFLAQRGMQFIDTLMMGWLGSTALAAGVLGGAFFGTVLLFCNGTLSVIGIFIVRAKGANNLDDIKLTMQHGVCLALLLSIPGMLLIWLAPRILLRIGEDPVVAANASLLLHGMVWGFPGILLFLVLRELVSAFSLTPIVLMVSLLSLPLTFVANYILMYGKYHFPELGIAGIGYGSSIVMWFMFLGLLIYSKKHYLLKKHLPAIPFQFNYKKLTNMLRVGIPSGLIFLLEAGMFLLSTTFMGYFGVAALAAHQIALQCVNIAYTFPLAVSIATALQVGHAASTHHWEKAKQVALISSSIVLFISVGMAMTFIFASHFLTTLFLNQGENHFQEAYQLALSFLHIAALFLCFDAMQSIANGALRGLKDTFVPMLLSVGCYWILGVGGAYYFSMVAHLGAMGIWYGLTLGLSSAAIILILRFFIKLMVMGDTKAHSALQKTL